jgi:hypothetical protein
MVHGRIMWDAAASDKFWLATRKPGLAHSDRYRTKPLPVAASRQSAAIPAHAISGALPRRRHAGIEALTNANGVA